MNAQRLVLMSVLATVWMALNAVGADPAPAKSTNAIPRTKTLSPITAPSITEAPAQSEAKNGEVPLVLSTTTSKATTPGEDTKRRLETPPPSEWIEKYGSGGFLIRQPDRRNFVELFNPRAPQSYGPRPKPTFNKDPNLKPGATLPRTFIRDGIRNEPDLKLYSVPF